MLNFIIKITTGLFLFICLQLQAATNIIVGPGKGIVWSGDPFTTSFNRVETKDTTMVYTNLIIALNANVYQSECSDTTLPGMEIISGGLWGLKLAQGIYLIPRVTVTGYMIPDLNKPRIEFNGTLGYPEIKVSNTNTPSGFCVQSSPNYYVRKGAEIHINMSGDWIIYADGTQAPTATPIKLPVFYANSAGLAKVSIDQPLTVKVTGVDCSVATQTNINFGNTLYNATPDAELGLVTSPFSVSCKQGSVPTAVNINASFKANTGIFNANNTQLALTQGGGYITGEIGNGLTGSGACVAHPAALNFGQKPLKLATLLATDPSVDMNSTITWRLCSAGATLPVGNISASTELSIVFN